MKLYYKLTDQDMKTRTGYYNEYQWELNKDYEIGLYNQDLDFDLCTKAWFHVYFHPLLAILLNPKHADIKNPRLFRCVCSGLHKSDNGLKEGFTKIKLTSEMQVPDITLTQRVAFGILCAKKVYFEKKWIKWANDWLKNIDRSYATADAAAYAALYTEHAAYAAVNAANAAAYAAADVAADAAADGEYAAPANVAANAAAYATYAAGNIIKIDLIKIAKQAMKY